MLTAKQHHITKQHCNMQADSRRKNVRSCLKAVRMSAFCPIKLKTRSQVVAVLMRSGRNLATSERKETTSAVCHDSRGSTVRKLRMKDTVSKQPRFWRILNPVLNWQWPTVIARNCTCWPMNGTRRSFGAHAQLSWLKNLARLNR